MVDDDPLVVDAIEPLVEAGFDEHPRRWPLQLLCRGAGVTVAELVGRLVALHDDGPAPLVGRVGVERQLGMRVHMHARWPDADVVEAPAVDLNPSLYLAFRTAWRTRDSAFAARAALHFPGTAAAPAAHRPGVPR